MKKSSQRTKMLLLCLFVFVTSIYSSAEVEVYMKDEAMHEDNITKPRIYIKNTGDESISDFEMRYYFNAEEGKSPVIEDYYTPNCDVTLKSRNGENEYYIKYSYTGVTLNPGDILPNMSGNAIGIHYQDWSSYNKEDDYSNNGSGIFQLNDSITVYQNGVLINGTAPVSESQGWVNLTGNSYTPEPISKEISVSDTDQFVIEYEVSGFQRNDVNVDGTTYQKVSIPSSFSTTQIGSPDIPLAREILCVPPGKEAVVEILSETHTDITGYNIYPVQEPRADSDLIPDPPFVQDDETYTTDSFYPLRIDSLSDISHIRGLPVVNLYTVPFQFNPVSGILRVYTSLEIKVSFVDDNDPNTSYIPLDEISDGTAIRMGKSLVSNPDLLPLDSVVALDDLNYLIISDTAFVPAAEKLASWKRLKGIKTEIVTTDSIGYDTSDIKSFIQTCYDTSETDTSGDPNLDFVLFFGDVEFIPTYIDSSIFGDNIGTDHLYSLLDGSGDNPDIATGRIPVDSLSEAFWVVDKIIQYEYSPPYDSSYYNSFTAVAYFQDDTVNPKNKTPNPRGQEDRAFLETTETISEFLDTNGYDISRFYNKGVDSAGNIVYPRLFNSGASVPSYLDTSVFDWDAIWSDIGNAIDSGTFLINQRDHGNYSWWGHPYYNSTHINYLSKTNMNPVIFSISCATGWFDNEAYPCPYTTASNDELCLSESFLRRDSLGCPGIIGSTRLSPSSPNDELAHGLFHALWPNFEPGMAGNNRLYRIGEVLNAAKGNVNIWPFFQNRLYHCFGDPAMYIWTEYPNSMEVYHNSFATVGDTEIKFKISEPGAKISLVINNEIVSISQSSSTSDTTVVDMSGMLDSSVVIDVGVTKNGFRPYKSRITVLPYFNTVTNCNGLQKNSGIAASAAVINNTAGISTSDVIEPTDCPSLLSYAENKWGGDATPVIPENIQFMLEHYTGDGVVEGTTIDPDAVGGPYNWNIFRHESIDSMLFDIAYWQYSVGLGTPIPAKGDYSHWVTLTATNASFPLNDTGNVKITGFWIDDPSSETGVHKRFMTADELKSGDFYLPTLGGQYEAVIEPPSTTGSVEYTRQEPMGTSWEPHEAAENGIDFYGLTQNTTFSNEYTSTTPGQPVLVRRWDGGSEFYLVPFLKPDGRTSIVVRVEVNNGYLLGVAYNNTESLPFPVDPSEELDTVPEFLWNSESGAGPYEPSEMEPDVLEIDSYGFDYTDKLDLSVDPSGLKIIFTNPDYLHGLMFTVRNKGLDDSVEVEWYGVTEENSGDCTNHEYQLNGDEGQINNACTPTDESGKMIVNLKSLKGSVSDVEFEVFNWRNGDGCN